MTKELRLAMLGGLQVTRDGVPVNGFVSIKAQALLCYLAVTGRPHRRTALAGLLWSEMPETDARTNLRQVLSNLRRLVGPHLTITRRQATFNQDTPHWLDVEAFRQGVSAVLRAENPLITDEQAATLARLVDLYRGDFLEGVYVRDALAFEEWALGQRARLQELALQALHALSAHYTARGDLAAGLAYTNRLLHLDPWREEAHRHKMLLLGRSGQREAALAQFQTCRQVLVEELGVAPTPETTVLYERIKALGTAPRHNLPPQPTPFVGREEELGEIARRLSDPTCRLLTLVGLGGSGKTRLALQAAQERAQAFLEGVCFVPLASVESAELLVPAIADALGFSFSGRTDPQAQLLNYLRDKEMLLVLDSFEHLLPPAGGTEVESTLLVEILTQARQVKILVTSRERLNLRWEQLLEVRGLPFPQDDRGDGIEKYGAVQLFLELARRVRPRFSPVGAERRHVTRICRLVEGMPLGIELAAAWVPVHSCDVIAQKIEHNLDFLVATLRDVPERHRSLRAVFAHSWGLLSEREQSAFRQLSVFRGGFYPDAAEQVAGATPAILAALVDKSLLRQSPAGRFEIHELLRQYAQAKLKADVQEQRRTHDRHGRFYTTFLQQRQGHLQGGRQKEAVQEIASEIENIRRAWAWAVEEQRRHEIAAALQGLYHFYEIRSWFQEGLEVLEKATQALGGEQDRASDALLGRLLLRQGAFCQRLARYERARELIHRSLEILRPLGEREQVALALQRLGYVAYDLGQYAEAEAHFREALEIQREIGDLYGMAASLGGLGGVMGVQSRHEAARQFCQESLDLCRKIGNQLGTASALNILGLVAHMQGNYREAREFYDECLDIRRTFGHRAGVALITNNLGIMAQDQGDYEAAKRLYRKSLTIKRQVGDRRGIASSLNNLGTAAHRLGESLAAQQWLQQSLTICREIGDRRGEANALNNLGEVAFARDELKEAQRLYQKSIAIKREIGDRWGLAHSLNALGDVAYASQAYDDAATLYRESLAERRELGDRKGIAQCLVNLGAVLHARKELAAAKDHLRRGLETASDIRALSVVLDALVGLATLLAGEGNEQAALEMLLAARDHPAGRQDTKARAERLWAELAAELPPRLVATVQEEAQSWEELVKEVLSVDAAASP